jgi:hypothetical protein
MIVRVLHDFASEELAQNGRPAPLWFCEVPLLYGGAGRRALCAFSKASDCPGGSIGVPYGGDATKGES